MSNSLHQLLSRDLKGYGADTCRQVQTYLRNCGHTTTNWLFSVQPSKSDPVTGGTQVRVVVECMYEREPDRRRIVFFGPQFTGTAFDSPEDVVAGMGSPTVASRVREWLVAVYHCKEALAQLMESGQVWGQGIVPWEQFGPRSDVLCILDGIPVPKVLNFPIEEVLPHRCFVHLVDGDTGEALVAAQNCAHEAMRHGKIVGWIGGSPPPVREQRYWAGTQAESVEEAQAKIMMLLGAKDRDGEPNPPALIVLVHPDDLPTAKEAQFPDPQVEPETAVMWASFLRLILLHRTTVLIVTSVPDIDSYPDKVDALVEPWRAIAKFERVYREDKETET